MVVSWLHLYIHLNILQRSLSWLNANRHCDADEGQFGMFSSDSASTPPQADSDTGDRSNGINANSFAVVPYNEDSVLNIHRTDRKLKIGHYNIDIKQHWNSGGVAAVVWDAAIVLAEFLEENSSLIKGKNAIELGAGTGVTGIIASKLGATVTLTDRPSALDYLHENVNGNLQSGDASVTVRALSWGQPIDAFSAPYDVILGADIIYIEDTFSDLLQTLDDLSDYRTVVYLACRIRYERDEVFLKMLKGKFKVDKIHYDAAKDIVLYSAQKLNTQEL